MITETREVYKCEHCRKMYQKKHFCEKHEPRCNENPVNDRPCFSCKHLEKVETLAIGFHYDGSDYEYKANVLRCSLKDTCLIPPIANHRGNHLDLIEDNEDMPLTCDKQQRLF